MIRYIDRIENFGVFSNYKRDQKMKGFERFNIIYGVNGSGKTTLSRLLACLNEGNSRIFPELKYEIETDDGKFHQGKPYPCQVRVFNSEYIINNIGRLKSKLDPIYIIGEENKYLAESIVDDKKKLSILEGERDQNRIHLENIKKKKNDIFTKIASEITQKAPSYVLRKYNRRKAEKAYNDLTSCQKLTISELAQLSNEIGQVALDHINFVPPPVIRIDSNKKSLFEAIEFLISITSTITEKNTISCAIDRLVKNPKLAKWIEHGRDIHTDNDDRKCEYCRQIIPEGREKELSAHFNQSDKDLRDEIRQIIEVVKVIIKKIKNLKINSDMNLYPEIANEWNRNVQVISKEKEKILSTLNKINSALKEKLTRRTESYSIEITMPNISIWNNAWSSISSLIKQHNHETDNYQKRLDMNFEKIQKHFLSMIDEDVKKLICEMESLEREINSYIYGDKETNKLGINQLKSRIEENQAKISNSHKAADDLSKKLASFLGRDDLRFESKEEGYSVIRSGQIAQHLSEGEKTAIAFLHFIVGLQDRDFNLDEGILIIDDPISSLDSNSMYQAFSYLRNSVENAKQIFILTHNFEFLKLILNWFGHIRDRSGKKTHLMLHCSMSEENKREAKIDPLDDVLIKNKSEFNYLFKMLVNFKSDGKIENAYKIPNIMRKILETFLEQHSSGKNEYEKLEKIDFDPIKKCAIYEFTNSQSHSTSSGIDPALIGETEKNINHLLEMISTVAPIYYKSLSEKTES